MKKAFLALISIIIFMMGCATGGSTSTNVVNVTTIDELDPIIREASDYLNTRIPQGRKAVFLNITSDYPDLSEYILSLLSENAVNDGIFSVVDRVQLDAIRTEMNFQLSGEVDDNSAQEIGKMLGAQTIVSGTVNKIGSLYRMQVKAIEVQTAGVQGQWSKTVPGGGTIIAALTEKYAPAPAMGGTTALVVSSGGNTTPATPSQAPAATLIPPPVQTVPAQAPTPIVKDVYAIGERGPAGGFIFYDKGNNSDGWRYLEAAPASGEFIAQWSEVYLNLSSTQKNIGSGKTNTEIIFAAKQYEFDKAAQRCDELELNGYNDWFLPSFAELYQMYNQLRRKRIGDFKDEIYWSSSQGENASNHYGAGCINFTTGEVTWPFKTERHYVRPIRCF